MQAQRPTRSRPCHSKCHARASVLVSSLAGLSGDSWGEKVAHSGFKALDFAQR